MAIVRIKRSTTASLAPTTAQCVNGELAFNEVDSILYYGLGGNGTASASVIKVGGTGAYLALLGGTLTGALTLSGAPSTGLHATTKTYVDTAIAAAGGAAAAGTLTGATLASNVLASSLTSVGTLAGLTVTATIVGSVNGNAATATTATNATNVAITSDNTATSYFVPFVTAASGNNALKADAGTGANGLTYQPSSATLTTGTITANTAVAANTINNIQGNLTIAPYDGNLIIAPVYEDPVGGTSPSITVSYLDNAAGLVTVTGGDLYLGQKVDTDPTVYPVNIIFEGATANNFETTLTVTDPTADRTITLPNATGTVALTTDLSQFAATSSAQLATLISDETGSGALVFATSPTLVTPALGEATATSLTAGNTGVKVGEHASRFLNITSDGSNSSITQSGNSTLTINHSAFGSIYIGDSDGNNNSTYIDVNDNAGTITFSGSTVLSTVTADAYKLSSAGISAKTASYTLVAGDNGKIITMNVASANNLTVPASLDVGFNCTVIQLGAGQTTIVASGTTLNSYQGYLKISGQHGSASIVSYVSNVYNVAGSLSA